MEKFVLVAVFLLATVAVESADTMKATCVVLAETGADDASIRGTITFEQDKGSDEVEVSVDLTGFTGGVGTKHGFHVHKTANMAEKCGAAEGHFNPTNVNHGAPSDSVRHVGDLGNIMEEANGVINVEIKDSVISLMPDSPNYIGNRAIVIHAGEDDLGKGGDAGSLATGNAGARMGCCPIKMDTASGAGQVLASTLLLMTSLVLAHM